MVYQSLNDLVSSNNPSNVEKLLPRIYVACLASYNNGCLYGKWILAAQEIEMIQKEIKKMLLDSPVLGAEEFAIHDFEGFGSLKIDEFETIKSVQNKAVFVSVFGDLGVELLTYCGDIESAQEALENCYYGEYDNELEFATQLFNDLYMASVPGIAQCYVDYAAFKRDIFLDDYFSVEVKGKAHVFSYLQ